ncbi:MAG: hypothetical protein ABWZ99_05920, partial [Ilumatobacteraceae bacterium]
RCSTSRRRRLMVLAGVTGGGALLVAAGTVSAYQLSIPPFQTTDPGSVRIERGIPVEYTNSLGRRVDCFVFMEFTNITAGQRDDLDKLAESPRWTGYGQQALNQLEIPAAPPEEQNDAIFDVVSTELWERARAAIPELVYMKESDGPVFHGTAMSCAGPGGVDGKP